MIRKQQSDGQQTVILTVDAISYSNRTVDLAIAIAAIGEGHLQGLFIEDVDLLSVAELPFTKEISYHTAQARLTDLHSTQRTLRSLADKFRRYLEQSAQASKVACSYDYRQGRVLDIGTAAESDISFIVIGQGRAQGRTNRLKSHARQTIQRILVIEDHTPFLLQALRVVLNQMHKQKAEITLLTLSHSESETSIAKQIETIAHSDSRVTLHQYNYDQLSEILATTASRYDYTVVSKNESPENLTEIINQLSCPIILVN
jgi:hypothetical protein